MPLRIYPEVHEEAEEEMTEPGSKMEAQGLNIHIISVYSLSETNESAIDQSHSPYSLNK
jgi:hypothetical protein